MKIEVGAVIQTTKYARQSYVGRRMLVTKIQKDLDPAHDLFIGKCILKRGGQGLPDGSSCI